MTCEHDPSSGSEEEDDVDSSDEEAELLERLDESKDQLVQSKAPSYEVITKEFLLATQREDLRSVMDLLSVSEHNAWTLLIHYRWDLEKLTEVSSDKAKLYVFPEAGVSLVEHDYLYPPESSAKVMCNVCKDNVPAKDATTMHCGHCFCNNFGCVNSRAETILCTVLIIIGVVIIKKRVRRRLSVQDQTCSMETRIIINVTRLIQAP